MIAECNSFRAALPMAVRHLAFLPMPTTEPGSLYPVFSRRCVICGRSMNGWGFYTLYGNLVIGGKKYIACGEPVHHFCSKAVTTREIFHDSYLAGESNTKSRRRSNPHTETKVALGVFQQESGRYGARYNQKRLGSYDTIEEAQAARAAYVAQIQAHKNGAD